MQMEQLNTTTKMYFPKQSKEHVLSLLKKSKPKKDPPPFNIEFSIALITSFTIKNPENNIPSLSSKSSGDFIVS